MVSFTSRPVYPVQSPLGTHWAGGLVSMRGSVDVLRRGINCHCQKPKYFVTDWLTFSLALRSSESLCLLNYRRPFFSAHCLLSPSFTLISRRSFSTSSIHLGPCLPVLLLPSGLLPSIFLILLHDQFLLDAQSVLLFLFNVCYQKMYLKMLTPRDLGDIQYKIRQSARTVYSCDCHNRWATLPRKYNLL